MTTDSTQQSGKRYIFLDTCILQFLGDKNKSKSAVLQKCLDTFVDQGFTLAISDISIYEHMHGLSGSKAEKAYALLQIYEWKSVTRDVIITATVLGGFYHDEKIDGIELGDKIIAATAISEVGFILTANHKDYPHPFFLTEESFPLLYEVGHYTRTVDVVLYKVNIELFLRRLKEKNAG